jgi:hypothetical protein
MTDATTPDGCAVTRGLMCACTVHRSGQCEATRCHKLSPWCWTLCHAEQYQRRTMRPVNPAKEESECRTSTS